MKLTRVEPTEICHTWADSFTGSRREVDRGFKLVVMAWTYARAVFKRSRYRSCWKTRCIAAKEKHVEDEFK